MSVLRARWAAIGAAVAVTLGAGGLATVSATEPEGAKAFVPISPCRLFDTRPDYQVGDRSTPLKEGETMTLQATGDNGNCKGIPEEATGISMNLTADRQTRLTFLTVWPADQEWPNASSINPFPGAPAPNAVTTKLSPDGKFKVYNEKGTTDVLADINGYYIDHDHSDLYYSKAEIDSRSPNNYDIVVGSSAFSPMAADASASRGMADGGVWQVGGSAPGLVADLQLPDTYQITSLKAVMWDNSTEDLTVKVQCESATGFTDLATGTSTGSSAKWASLDLTQTQLGINPIDNAECAYRVLVTNANWGTEQDALRIKSVHMTVKYQGTIPD